MSISAEQPRNSQLAWNDANPPISFLDSPLTGAGTVPDEVREVFGYHAFLRRCVEVEVALARAQARLGIIPVIAAEGIAAAAQSYRFDIARLAREAAIVGYPVLPIVEQLATAAGEAGGYLHWGATTQDVMDTATVLQVRAGLEIIERRLDETISALKQLVVDHRTTPMAGRTHLQQALPITFGYKAAVWLSGLLRHRERIAQAKTRALVVEFSGAAGTLASLGDQGLIVQAPMTRVSATADGNPTPRMVDYYRSFSEGGFGLIISEGIYTDRAFFQGYLHQPACVTTLSSQGGAKWSKLSTARAAR